MASVAAGGCGGCASIGRSTLRSVEEPGPLSTAGALPSAAARAAGGGMPSASGAAESGGRARAPLPRAPFALCSGGAAGGALAPAAPACAASAAPSAPPS
eukprot:1146941-Prymnesium_polylepis.1